MMNTGTGLLGLLGDPVAHSVSPAMHNAAIDRLGLDYVYLAFRVTPAGLAGALNGVRALGIRGVNLTIPHKTAALGLLDEVDEAARRVGAVNTVVNDAGRLTGYNTDIAGFLAALKKHGFAPAGQKAVVLGAGGAARAVVFALRDAGAEVVIANRSIEKADTLAADTGATAVSTTETELQKALDGAGLLVNATPVGLFPDTGVTPVPGSLLHPGLTVFDTIYRPRRTRLLTEAEAAGCRVIDGLDMLVEQGATAFELWTGQSPDRAVMLRSAAAAMS
ncbi:shikimate 5-dehydrogenase [Dehalogenimonas lykanthroporepellens BL-DC-9]|nr:shikimate 5-dehydrogenase [Dehalogenimonas lykanthroporepellens BL-DC-9]